MHAFICLNRSRIEKPLIVINDFYYALEIYYADMNFDSLVNSRVFKYLKKVENRYSVCYLFMSDNLIYLI